MSVIGISQVTLNLKKSNNYPIVYFDVKTLRSYERVRHFHLTHHPTEFATVYNGNN